MTDKKKCLFLVKNMDSPFENCSEKFLEREFGAGLCVFFFLDSHFVASSSFSSLDSHFDIGNKHKWKQRGWLVRSDPAFGKKEKLLLKIDRNPA